MLDAKHRGEFLCLELGFKDFNKVRTIASDETLFIDDDAIAKVPKMNSFGQVVGRRRIKRDLEFNSNSFIGQIMIILLSSESLICLLFSLSAFCVISITKG